MRIGLGRGLGGQKLLLGQKKSLSSMGRDAVAVDEAVALEGNVQDPAVAAVFDVEVGVRQQVGGEIAEQRLRLCLELQELLGVEDLLLAADATQRVPCLLTLTREFVVNVLLPRGGGGGEAYRTDVVSL